MAAKTTIQSLAELQRFISKLTNEPVDRTGALDWLENTDQLKGSDKERMRLIVIHDTAQKGGPEDLIDLQQRGYDLGALCAAQRDGNALHVAAQYGRHRSCDTLMAMGMAPEHRCFPTTSSALDEALINLHFSLFERLRKRAPKPTEHDQNEWLMAAVSAKVRQDKQGKDHPRERCVDYVLNKTGATFSQDTLDTALYEAARHGWPKTFRRLVEGGANPERSYTLMGSHIFGEGTLLLELFLKMPLEDWPLALNRYVGDLKGFYPQPALSSDIPTEDIERVYQALRKASRAAPNPKVETTLAQISARHRENELSEQLPVPTPTRSRPKPRF